MARYQLLSRKHHDHVAIQVFTGGATSRALLGQDQTIVNALISPTGEVGKVKISTGPLSSNYPDAIVPVETAIAMLKDMGASSVKFFNMEGLKYREEYQDARLRRRLVIAC